MGDLCFVWGGLWGWWSSLCSCPQAHTASTKQGAVKPKVFLDIHSDICGLILPMAAVEKVINEQTSWANVEADLQEVVSSSTLGRRLFGFALEQVLSSMVAIKMEEVLHELHLLPMINSSAIMSAKREIMLKVDAMQNIEIVPAKRTIKVEYRGVEFSISISGIAEEFDMRAAAFVKSEAASCGDIMPLFCENELVKDRSKGFKGKIHPDLLKHVNEARSVANASLEGDACRDGRAIKAFRGKHIYHNSMLHQ